MSNMEILIILVNGLLSISILYLLLRFIKKINKFKYQNNAQNFVALKEAPSVSVCIPVRNEHHAVEDCLTRVLSSNYPKMEVIVLDDESVDNTSEIVKLFAHAGVRFIKGQKLTEGWLGRNNAMDQLAREATGKYIVFMSVDTDISPQTISQAVSILENSKSKMMSIMPQRNDLPRASVFFGTMRYLEEILFDSTNDPAVSTSFYIVERDYLEKMNYFETIKNDLKPEHKIAEELQKSNSYRFILSDKNIGLKYEKRLSSQRQNTIRTYGRSLFLAGNKTAILFTIALFLYLVLIVLNIIYLFMNGFNIFILVGLAPIMAFGIFYAFYTYYHWSRLGFVGFFVAPFAVIQELILIIISIFKVNSKTLTWKDREFFIDQ